MKRILKKVIPLVCFFFMICFVNVFSRADGEIIDGSMLTHEDYAEDIQPLLPEEDAVPAGVYLSNGVSRIQKQGSGLVYLVGATYCYRKSDTVHVEIYLERLSNGGWQTVKTHSYNAYNSDYAYTGVNFAVSKGYYYRVRGYHYAKKGSTVESCNTCTSALYID